MDSFTNAAKRKKRKTRKCLDEMRKRSYRTSQILKDDKLAEIYSKNIRHSTITNNRLTLKMFPNAIQSKTITRPVLLDLQHKQNLNLDELVNGSNVITAQNSDGIRIPFTCCSNTQNYENETHTPENYKLNSTEIREGTNFNDNIGSKESLVLFSSLEELENISPSSIDTHTVGIASPTSTQSLQDEYAYRLYEEFMSELPLHVQQSSHLNHEDLMKKNKVLLQKLLIESCYQECEDDTLKPIKHDTPKSLNYTSSKVMHDPIDYIRLNHICQDKQLDKTSDPITSSESTAHRPLRAPSSLTSPSDAPLNAITQDTPDYTYYPHRLN